MLQKPSIALARTLFNKRLLCGTAVKRLVVFTLLLLTVAPSAWADKSWAIWSPKNKTLYFVRSNTYYKNGGTITYNKKPNCKVWQVADKEDNSRASGSKTAQWANKAKKTCTTVVFDNSFRSAKPLSCASWFKGFNKLNKIKGLINLNTSEVTNMSYMFKGCKKLTSLDLSSFNTKKVTNMTKMFYNCQMLESIYVSNGWGTNKVKISAKMFYGCSKLKKYKKDATDKTRAHTGTNGYLKYKDQSYMVIIDDKMEFGDIQAEPTIAEENEPITLTVEPDEGYELETLTVMKGKTKVPLTNKESGTYTFNMPAQDVTVSATFKELLTIFELTGNVDFYVNVEQETSDDGIIDVPTKTDKAKSGTEVIVKVSVPTDKELDEVTAVTGTSPVNLIEEEDGTYTFIMPNGAVEVTATFKDEVIYELAGSNVRFRVGEELVTEAKNGVKVTVEPGSDAPALGIGKQYVFESDEVTIDEDNSFIMPKQNVTVDVVVEDIRYPLTGRYLSFYDGDASWPTLISEAVYGQTVVVSCDPLTFEPGMYFAGTYVSNPNEIVSLDPDGTLDGVFTMPAQAVTVDAELVAQKVLEIDLSDDSEKDITFEQASHFMQLEGYLVDKEEIRTNNSTFPYTNKYYFDLNLNGEADVLMAITVNDADGNGSQTLKRLKAEGDVAVALITPGLPYAYKEIMLHLGGEEATVHNVSFYDGLSNLNTVKSFKDLTVNALLADRILYKDGCWNTLCLPFDVTIAESPLAGDGVTVKTLQSATFENGKLTLKFTPGSLDIMEANKPYIIKWNKPENYKTYDYNDPTAAYSDLVAPLFTDVVISNDDLESVGDNVVSFIGTYMPIEFEEEDPNVLILGADNELFYPAPSLGYCYLNAQRAYFYLLKDSAKKLTSSDGARSIILDFSDEEVTSLMDNRQWITEHRAAATGWYSLDGRKLNSEPKAKGIYIYNGKKIKK